jgi:hypothetical protein
MIPIREIRDKNLILKLDWPIVVEVEERDSWFLASCDDFNVHGAGETRDEALEDFHSTFLHFWRYYNEIDAERVTGLAKKLKVLFSHVVKEIVHADPETDN